MLIHKAFSSAPTHAQRSTTAQEEEKKPKALYTIIIRFLFFFFFNLQNIPNMIFTCGSTSLFGLKKQQNHKDWRPKNERKYKRDLFKAMVHDCWNE
jgi:hypothetical protein